MIIPGVIASAGGGGGYHANAVHFDANTFLEIASLTATNNAFCAWSMWFKYVNNADLNVIWDVDGQNNGIPEGAWTNDAGTFKIQNRMSDANNNFQFSGTTQVQPSANNWHNMLWAADTTNGAGLKIMKCYIDDVDTALTLADASPGFNNTFNGVSFDFNNDTFGTETVWDVADVWFGIGQNLLVAGDIPLATRRKFINASKKPVDLGADGSTPTGVAPAIFFSGNAASFGTNKGPGGAFTTHGGPLTNASTSPSD